MTVKEAIKLLEKLPDKNLAIMLDCPNCGHAHQLATIGELVVLGTKVKK